MRFFFDTEFLEDGQTITLLSIGIVNDKGDTFYAVNGECDQTLANPWVVKHVLPYLQTPEGPTLSMLEIRAAVLRFMGAKPKEIWAYNGAYDWVVLCQLFGPMVALPDGWPTYHLDIKQWRDHLNRPKLPKQTSRKHHALNDALWVKDSWHFLKDLQVQAALLTIDHTTKTSA